MEAPRGLGQSEAFEIPGEQQGFGVWAAEPVHHRLAEGCGMGQRLEARIHDDPTTPCHPLSQMVAVERVESEVAIDFFGAHRPGPFIEAVDRDLRVALVP